MFNFQLTTDDEKRNAELLALTKGYNKVVFGGIVLAAKSIKPRQVSFQPKNKNWFAKIDAGISTEDKVTDRANADGTHTKITERKIVRGDGAVTTEITEETFGNSPVQQSTTTTRDVPLVDPSTAGIGEDNDLWIDKLLTKKTTTLTTPVGSQIEYVSEVVEKDPENPKNRQKYTKKYVNDQKPVPPAVPVTVTTITGKIYDQFIGPPPPQGQDATYWNQEMFNTETTEDVSTVRNNDGTESTVTTTKVLTPDGFMKVEEVTSLIQLEPEDDSHTTVTRTEKSPATEVKKVTIYDKNNLQRSETITTTYKYDTVAGQAPLKVTRVTVMSTDNLGKQISKETVTTEDPNTGEINVEETETLLDPGEDTITYNRQLNRDEITGLETLSETVTRTNGYGESTSESSTKKSAISRTQHSSSIEKSPVDDRIVDDLFNGWLVTEYAISGELMSMPQAFRIMNKMHEHQTAWAFIQIRDQQLGLGDKLSPDLRKQLYREQQAAFQGEELETVKGGPVLDRIEMVAFGETALPVVFANSSDAFTMDWIDGSYGLWAWTLKVQVYTQVIRDKDNTFRQERNGGLYGRVDNQHWTDTNIPSDLIDDDKRFKGPTDGGTWSFN